MLCIAGESEFEEQKDEAERGERCGEARERSDADIDSEVYPHNFHYSLFYCTYLISLGHLPMLPGILRRMGEDIERLRGRPEGHLARDAVLLRLQSRSRA